MIGAFVPVHSNMVTVNIPEDVFEQFVNLPMIDDGLGMRQKKLEYAGFLLEHHEIYCQDCNDTEFSIYMVHDTLWKEFGTGKGRLCIFCFEKRLGRKVTLDDLNDAPINEYWRGFLNWKVKNGQG